MQVAALLPQSAEAHANLASSFKDCGRQEDAMRCYLQAFELRPDYPEALANLVHSMQSVCDWSGREQLIARCVSAKAPRQVDTVIIYSVHSQ